MDNQIMSAKIAAAFVKAQAEFGGAVKDSMNPQFRSKYADLESVVDAIRPALSKHGLAFIQRSIDKNGDEVAIETIIVHESGDQYSCGVLSVPFTKKDAQGFGSAMTYIRRYSLQAAFGIAPEDDDGNAAVKAAPHSAAIPDKPAAAQPQVVQPVVSALAAKPVAMQADPAVADLLSHMKSGAQSLDLVAPAVDFDGEVASPEVVTKIREELMTSGKSEIALLNHLKSGAQSLDLITPAVAERAMRVLGIKPVQAAQPAQPAPAKAVPVVSKTSAANF